MASKSTNDDWCKQTLLFIGKSNETRSLLGVISVSLTYLDCVTYLHPTVGVILQSCLPITATSLQWPLYFVPKVAVEERFDCISMAKKQT